MTVRVFFAFSLVGSRKARTPLLTASTPVSAVQPLAKAFSSSHAPTIAVAGGTGGGAATGMGCPCESSARITPISDRDQQRAQEQIRRNHEDAAGFLDAAQIHDGDQHQNAETHRERVRQQRWNRRHQRAHSGRDSNRGRKHVIDEQSGRRQQTRARADILARYRVGSASARIRVDGLAIREVDDGKQQNDGAADGHDVGDAQRAERDQDGERRFRTVCRGAERVQSEDGDAGGGADALAGFLPVGERLAEQQVEEGHQSM